MRTYQHCHLSLFDLNINPSQNAGEEITENLLTEHVHASCVRDIEILRVPNVQEKLSEFVRVLKQAAGNEHCKAVKATWISSV